jgi:hypothetical protein
MITDHTLSLPDLRAFLSTSEQQDQELRAVIASQLTSDDDRMQALLELARLSSDLTVILAEVIRTVSK